MSDLIPVRFLARYSLYNEGEVAGLPPGVAAQLIAQGRAEAFESGATPGASSSEAECEGETTTTTDGEGSTPPAEKVAKPKGKK